METLDADNAENISSSFQLLSYIQSMKSCHFKSQHAEVGINYSLFNEISKAANDGYAKVMATASNVVFL